jgi:hypothetical protein
MTQIERELRKKGKLEIFNFAEKCIGVEVSLSKLGDNRAVDSGLYEVEANKAFTKMSKALFSCEEWKQIGRLDGAISAYMRAKALPSIIRRGAYLIPVTQLDTVDAQLMRFEEQRQQLIDKFMDVYPTEVEKMKENLGVVYDPADYPTADEVRRSFRMNVRYVSFAMPGTLGVNSEIFNRECERVKTQWAEVYTSLQSVLREQLDTMIKDIQTNLKPDEEGKPKRFRGTFINKVREFLDGLDIKNIVDDEDLSDLIKQAKGLLEGVDTADLKDQKKDIREKVLAGFSAIREKMSEMTLTAPSRLITFEE